MVHSSPTAKYPSALLATTDVGQLSNLESNSLNGAINSSATSIVVSNDITNWPTSAVITIDNERILYTSKDNSTKTLTVPSNPNGRGWDGSTAASHGNGASVRLNFVAFHYNQLLADVIAIQTQLGANLSNVVAGTRTLTAGAGLTGGGDLSANRTFDVGAGTGITVNANDVAINQAFTPTWTGVHTFSAAPVITDLSSMTHSHQNSAGGGTLDTAAIAAGTLVVARGGTGTGTAFTLGSVVFAGASGVYAQDNAKFFYDTTNDRLGLGNAAPAVRLHLTADDAAGGDTLKDVDVRLTAQYWNGAATTARNATITHNVTATSPASQLDIDIAGTVVGTLTDGGDFTVTGDLKSKSGTSFTGAFAHAITADRTWTLQDSSDTLVGRATTDTLTNKTLTTPTIGDFTNANHIHEGVASGGTLSILNATTGTLTVARGGTGGTTAAAARSGISAAPNDAQYLTLATNSELTVERVLTAGSGLTFTDAGAGSTLTVDWDGVTLRKNTGADVGTRRRINLIEGSNITLTVTDDAGSAEVDVTIAAVVTTAAGWADDGTVVRLDTVTDQVGIGTASPIAGYKLHVVGNPVLADENYAFKSGTSFIGTLDHAITANRTWTFPDAAGTVTLDGTASTFSATKTFSSAPTFSTMTQGSIMFAGSGGALTQDNASLFWDAANDRIGFGTATPSVRVHLAADAECEEYIESAVGNANGSSISLRKARGSLVTKSIVASGDVLGHITALGHDGTTYQNCTRVSFEVDAAPGNGDMPGRIVFKTSSDGNNELSERMRITSAGRLGVNEASPDELVHISTDSSSGAALKLELAETSANGMELKFAKSRGTRASPTVPSHLDLLGAITWTAYDGNSYKTAARISAIAGTIGGGGLSDEDVPAALAFYTTPDGSATPVQRLRIISSGHPVWDMASAAVTGSDMQNSQMTWYMNSNTQVIFQLRGTDGNVRTSTMTFS